MQNEQFPYVFCSGSCRLLTSIYDGRGKVIPIHSMFRNFTGINFLGKLHNTKQHIQFLKFVLGKITIPENILKMFLISYAENVKNTVGNCEPRDLIPIKIKSIRDHFNLCSAYLFEICSLKIYEKDGFQIQCELTNDNYLREQTKQEIINDLEELYNLIPKGKRIIFQCHFRQNIIHNNPAKKIENREIIYSALIEFQKTHNNVIVCDPSDLVKNNLQYYDGDKHFWESGHLAFFEVLLNLINQPERITFKNNLSIFSKDYLLGLWKMRLSI